MKIIKNIKLYLKYNNTHLFRKYFLDYRIIFEEGGYRYQGYKLILFGIIGKWVYLDFQGDETRDKETASYKISFEAADKSVKKFVNQSEQYIAKLTKPKIQKTYEVKTKETHPETFV